MGLDFHRLFTSDVTLFSHGIYLEIESLRLDLHLKIKQRKPQQQQQKQQQKKPQRQQQYVFIREGKKKKLETETGVVVKENWVARCDLGRARLGLTWLDRRACVSISSSSSLSFSLSLFFPSTFFAVRMHLKTRWDALTWVGFFFIWLGHCNF